MNTGNATSYVDSQGKTVIVHDYFLTIDQIERANRNEYSYYTTNDRGIEQHQSVFTNGSTFWMQAPENGVNEDTVFCIVQGGDGGVLADTRSEYYSAQNPDDNQFLITTNSLSRKDYNKSEAVIEDMAEYYGANSRNRVYMGHSISGDLVTNRAAEYLINEHNEGNQTRTMVVLNDASGLKPLFNSDVKNKDEKIESFDDSLVIASVQTKYFNEKPDGSVGIVPAYNGGKLDAYNEDLEDIARAGGNVLLVAYKADVSGDAHTESVGVSAELGFDNPATAVLKDGEFTFTNNGLKTINCSQIEYYYFDTNTNQWTKFDDVESAQNYLDYSAGKVNLYNSGFLTKEDGTYHIESASGPIEISEMDLERMILDFKHADPEKVKDMTLEEYIGVQLSARTGNEAEYDKVYTARALELLKDSMGDIRNHMNSLTSLNNLGKSAGEASNFASNCASFPSGVNTSGFRDAIDCVNQFGVNLENAYNETLKVHNSILDAEGIAPTFYQSNTFANAAANTQTSDFASDVTYIE